MRVKRHVKIRHFASDYLGRRLRMANENQKKWKYNTNFHIWDSIDTWKVTTLKLKLIAIKTWPLTNEWYILGVESNELWLAEISMNNDIIVAESITCNTPTIRNWFAFERWSTDISYIAQGRPVRKPAQEVEDSERETMYAMHASYTTTEDGLETQAGILQQTRYLLIFFSCLIIMTTRFTTTKPDLTPLVTCATICKFAACWIRWKCPIVFLCIWYQVNSKRINKK